MRRKALFMKLYFLILDLSDVQKELNKELMLTYVLFKMLKDVVKIICRTLKENQKIEHKLT